MYNDTNINKLKEIERFTAITSEVLKLKGLKAGIQQDSSNEVSMITDMIKAANKLLDAAAKKNFKDFLKKKDIEIKICSHCGDFMIEGYCIGEGDEYYCTDKCLKKNMSWEEYLERYEDSEGDSYWTQWV